MEELIARLERATKGSSNLDQAIQAAIGPHFYIPCYTISIDDALTLVPLGMKWTLATIDPQPPGYRGPCEARVYVPYGSWLEGHHPTSPAIALCIASLRARTAIQKGE